MKFCLIGLIFFFVLSSLAGKNQQRNAIFSENPGLAAASISVDVSSLWSDFVPSSDLGQAYELPLLTQFNSLAQTIWDKLSNCYEGDVEQVRKDYFQRRLKCEESAIASLHRDVLNWLETSTMDLSELQFTDPATIEMPPFHPLLGQIFTEIFAYQKSRLTDFAGTGIGQRSWFPIGPTEADIIYYRCFENAGTASASEYCNKGFKIARAYKLIWRLLSVSRYSCLSFGLAPNATYYLFARALLVTEGRSIHPIYTYRHSMQPKMSLEKGLQPESCWEGLGEVQNQVRQTPNTMAELGRVNLFFNHYVRFYNRLLKYYLGGR